MTPISPSTIDGLLQMIEQNDEKYEDGHLRLRTDVRANETRIESNYRHFDDQVQLIKTRLGSVEGAIAQPIDATKLMLTTRAIIAVVGAALVVSAALWTVRTDVQRLGEKVDQQQREASASSKLQEVQMSVLRDSLTLTQKQSDDARRQYELLRYEFSTLKDTVLKGRQ